MPYSQKTSTVTDAKCSIRGCELGNFYLEIPAINKKICPDCWIKVLNEIEKSKDA